MAMEASLFARAACVILVFCLAHTDSQITLHDPIGQSVPTNGSLHLSCLSQNSAATAWFKGQPGAGLVPVTGDTRIVTNGSDLSLSLFHASEHSGLYYCLVTTLSGGKLRSCPAHVTHARIHHHFSEEPEDTTVGLGATALLRCHLSDSNPPAVYRWKKNGQPIDPDNDRVILSPSGYLYVRNVSVADEGEYQCLAENEMTGKTRRSRISFLSVNASLSSPPPRLVSLPPTSVTVHEGGRAVFECATDSPTATITWSHNTNPSLPTNSHVLPTGPLVIENATPSDSGPYVCTLTDSNGAFVSSAFPILIVTSSPTVTVAGPDTVPEGTHLSLACSVTSTTQDPITVVWFKGDVIIQSSQHNTMGTVVNTLVSRDSAHLNDTGLYQCMAYDSAGCGHDVAMVTVVEATPPPPLTVSVELLNETAALCTVTGDIASITFVVWKYDSKILNYFDSSSGNSTHIVKDFQLSLSGRYLCEVRTISGIIFSDSLFYLKPTSPPSQSSVVVVETTPTSSAPVASPQPSQPPPPPPVTVSVSLAGSVVHCIVSGDLSLISTGLWLLDGSPHGGHFAVPQDSVIGFFTSTVLSNPGTYTCQVELNSGTFVSDSIEYSVAVATSAPPPHPSPTPSPIASPQPPLPPPPPPPPVSVSVTIFGSEAFCVMQGDLSLILTGLWEVNGSIGTSISVPSNAGSLFHSSTDLSESGTYTCVIWLTGGLQLSDSVNFVLPSPSPSPLSPSPMVPAPSVTLSVQSLSTSIKCILSGDLDAITFSLWIIHNGDDILETSPFSVDTSRPAFYTSLPLSLYANYTCRVTLSNGETVTGSKYHPPPPPRSSPSPSPTSTSPTDPPIVDLRVIEGGYMVCTVALSESDISHMMLTLGGDIIHSRPMFGENTAVLTTLTTEPGTYQCIVTTTNGGILTASLDVSPPTTPTKILPPPTSLTAEWVFAEDGTFGNIRVTWGEPPETEGLLGYKINWDPPTLIEKVGRTMLRSDVFEYTIETDLDLELPYVIMVWAFTSNGDQEAARYEIQPAIVKVVPSPTPPPPPPSLTDCKAVSSNSATLSWQINGREQETAEVTYGCEDAGTTTSLSLPLSAETPLSNLLPDCRYLVESHSQICHFTTLPGPITSDYNVTIRNGALVVTWWGLPPELDGESGEGVKVEVNVSGEWVEVGGANNHTILSSTSPNIGAVHIRFSLGKWSSILSVPVPTPTTNETTPTPTDDAADSAPSLEEQVFLYGTVIAVAVIVCVVVVAIIMCLKYIQMTHRDTDKVTDHRLYQRQQFYRMSLEKSSLKKSSLKNEKNHHSNGLPGVNGINGTAPRNRVTRITHV